MENEDIIETLDQVLKIHEQGRINRLNAEKELIGIEKELKVKLLELQTKSNEEKK